MHVTVYRYQNVFLYNDYDSFDGSIGLSTVLGNLMTSPSNAITLKRQELQEILDNLDTHNLLQGHGRDLFSRQRSQSHCFRGWICEIDLDHNIFHVNGFPFFSLECLPGVGSFFEYINNESKDHYGHLTCPPTCPPEQQYKKSPPPVVDDSDVATYQSLVCTGTWAVLSDLLAIGDALSPEEHVRVSLLETLIGQCMTAKDIAHVIHDLWLITGPDQLTDDAWLTASSMANLAFIPQIFGPEPIVQPELHLGQKFKWVRKDTVLYISTHLHDERCLQAAISRLIDEILDQTGNNVGDFFGVAFSIFHCAVVKVVKDRHTATFSHTVAFEFLPSFYADSPSTPGITALARLGYRIDPELFERVTKIFISHGRMMQVEDDEERIGHEGSSIYQKAGAPPSIGYAELPLELWQEVALHLQLSDLLSFGLISELCHEAASMVLRHPHFYGYRLVAVAEEKPDYILQDYCFLHASCYVAEQTDVLATVIVGELSEWGVTALIRLPLRTPFLIHGSVEVESESAMKDIEARQKMTFNYAFRRIL